MAERIVLQLVDAVHTAAVNLGVDLSVEDVAFIIATFFEGLAAHPAYAEVNAPLLAIAAEVALAKDE